MALQAAYKKFLASPNTSALADDASLHYVTTTTSVAGATDIIKHLATVRNRIKKIQEEPLFAIENQHALAIEFDTTLEFVSSGGPYLPGLDDNFLADRTVFLAVSHVVSFNTDGKITQIRQSWDQGSLLKQVEVIGRSGANWPIRNARDQIALISKCAKGDAAAAAAAAAANQALPTRSRGSSNAMRDPHATLDLFAPREELESVPATVVSPYAGRRPRQRSFTEILGDEPVEDPESPSSGRDRSQSPSKAIAPKVGAGKNFQRMRLFEADEEDAPAAETEERPRSLERVVRPDPRKYQHFELNDEAPAEPQEPERVVRPDPRKFQHFELDDGSGDQEAAEPETKQAPAPRKDRKSKNESTWSFDDFTTPQKHRASRVMHRARDIRHWGEDNEVLENTPAPHPHVVKPRRDAESHFELVDDGPVREGAPAGRPRGARHNESLHLYDNRLPVEDEDGAAADAPAALGNVTNIKPRRKDLDPHFIMADESPQTNSHAEAKPVPEDRKKAVRMMESNWAPYDESPVSRKENANPNGKQKLGGDRGIVIAGDGMGSRKGTSRGWFHGEDDEPAPVKKGVRGPPTKSDGFWDF
ncbi:hypothetical protein VTJ83DRAFT_538 [Remersonia thermophila]|uniref:NTF2-like protein n=1 Tax=Remersonia thermophila TaxID=72144 RepID=A0ABR4DLH6_9PEZI